MHGSKGQRGKGVGAVGAAATALTIPPPPLPSLPLPTPVSERRGFFAILPSSRWLSGKPPHERKEEYDECWTPHCGCDVPGWGQGWSPVALPLFLSFPPSPYPPPPPPSSSSVLGPGDLMRSFAFVYFFLLFAFAVAYTHGNTTLDGCVPLSVWYSLSLALSLSVLLTRFRFLPLRGYFTHPCVRRGLHTHTHTHNTHEWRVCRGKESKRAIERGGRRNKGNRGYSLHSSHSSPTLCFYCFCRTVDCLS